MIKNKRTGITLCNEVPVCKPGISYWHDVYYKKYPQNFVTIKEKVDRIIVLIIYRAMAMCTKRIVTGCEYVKKEICECYHVNPKRVKVTCHGWQHINPDIGDETIFDRLPTIKKGKYYFSLGNISKRKNTMWFIRYAEKHPESMFLLSGRVSDFFVDDMHPDNIILLGYTSDEEMIALMRYCKVFVFPSFYEGFGIPPLEAISLGAKAIVARSSCLPEVFGDSVYYIDPNDTDVSLDDLLKTNLVKDSEEILKKYSWEKAAIVLKDLIYEL